jgi:hypothetical protein
VIRAAFIEGMVERVYADETRPWLQGSRLTAWELANEGIPVTLNADSAAAHIMKTKGITWVIVGATASPPMATWQQDRHLSAGGQRHAPRRALHGGGAEFDHRHEPGQWRRHSD